MNKDGYSIFEKYKNKSAKQEIVQEGIIDVLKLRNNQVITASNLMLESDTANHVGLGCKNPTRYHSAGRKTLVYRELQAKARKKLQNNSSSEF